jgi:hypothetical protein
MFCFVFTRKWPNRLQRSLLPRLSTFLPALGLRSRAFSAIAGKKTEFW